MVVLAILGIIGTVVAININKTMTEQRFRTEVASVVNQLRIAQNLMLIVDQEVLVTFTQNGPNQINFGLEIQCPTKKGWEKELTRKPNPLKTIRYVDFFNAETNTWESASKLKFMSGGLAMSRGILRLSNDKKSGYEEYVCLPGFPSPIISTSERQAQEQCLNPSDRNMNDYLTMAIMQEVTSKTQQNNQQIQNKDALDKQPSNIPPKR
jgi:type II secretory pathway pseudopilin PulG